MGHIMSGCNVYTTCGDTAAAAAAADSNWAN